MNAIPEIDKMIWCIFTFPE